MGNSYRECGITYMEVGDYFLPNLVLPEQKGVGIYGQRHKRFLKQYQSVVYTTLLITGKLQEYLLDVDERATRMKDQIVREMAVKEGLREQLKEESQMEWAGRMNQFYMIAEEFVCKELIYVFFP